MSGSAGPVPHQPQGLAAPAPAARPGMMAEMPTGDSGIEDRDLYTQDEAATKMAALMGVDPSELGVEPAAYDHNENLAEALDSNWLDTTGQEIVEMVEADLQSRGPWDKRFKRGLELVGLKDFVWEDGVAPFEGASNAILPLLAEAIVQAQARLMEEIFPAQGPVKTMVMGQETPQKRDAADRVADHMNFQLTVEDETYFMESQKLGIYLPIFGTAYRKGYHDYVTDQNLLRYIPGQDLILPYSARDARSAPRKTHRFKVGRNEFRRAVVAGAYRDIELEDAPEAAPDQIKQEIDKTDSITPSEADKDQEWDFYETDIALEIPGYEDQDDEGATGVALPYTVTLEKESGKILAIRRCWKADDPLKLMRTRYAEYWYLPGLGAYGTGLIHWIGTIAESGTDALRALLDSATWANLQGGFKAKDAGVKAGELHVTPGTWQDVDMTADELSKAFHTLPVKEPSEALFKLLGLLIDLGRRFSSTTDMMVGDEESKGAPVGTTIAMIEQGSKVYSGTHKRAHNAAGTEFRMLFELNAEYIPEEGYPYQVPGDDKAVYRADYDTQMVSVVPVSDPNIFSQTQRIALAQSKYQLFKDNPVFFRGIEVMRGLLKAFKDPEADTSLVDPDAVPVMDPVSENIAMATGRPVKAKDGENHDAHLISHMAFAQHPQFGGLPQAQELLGPAMIAHIAEHVGLKYADTQRRLGVPVPPLNLSVPNGASISGPENPQQSDVIAQMAAQQVGAFMQQSGLTTTPPDQGGAGQDAADAHALNVSKTWANIANALAAMAKTGLSLQDGMAAEAAVEGGAAPPAPDQGGALGGPAGPAAPAPAPGAAPAPPAPAVAVHVHPTAPAPIGALG